MVSTGCVATYFVDISLPEIFHGEKIVDRKSVFQGHLAAVTHRQQVCLCLSRSPVVYFYTKFILIYFDV